MRYVGRNGYEVSEVTFEDRLMAVMPDAVRSQHFVFSGDCRVIAYLARVGAKASVFVGAIQGMAFDEVGKPVLNHSGTTVAYRARCHHRPKATVVTNGVCGPEFDWVSDPIVNSNSSVVSYLAMRRKGETESYCAVINDVEMGPHEAVHTLVPGSGDKVAYAATTGGRHFAIMGGQKYGPFDRAARLQFDQEGGLYYWGFKEGKWFLFRDGKEISYSEDPVQFLPWPVIFAPSGKRIAFWRKLGTAWFLESNGSVSQPYADWEATVGMPVFGPKEDRLAYVIKDRAKVAVIVDGASSRMYDAVGTPTFSPDDKILAFKARDGEREFLVMNGNEGKSFDVIWPEEREYSSYLEDAPAFDRNNIVTYRGRLDEEEFVMLGDSRGPGFNYIVGAPGFGPGSSAVAYGGMKDGMQFAVFDDIVDGPYDNLWSPLRGPGLMSRMWSPVFSTDGRKVAFGARKGSEIWLKTIATH